MANLKSAIKRIRKILRQNVVNRLRKGRFKRALKKSKQLHFALENLVLKKSSDITIINNLFHIKLAYQKCLSLENIKKNIDLHTKN